MLILNAYLFGVLLPEGRDSLCKNKIVFRMFKIRKEKET